MPKYFLRVVGSQDPDDPGVDLLWLLIGSNELCEVGKCFGLPPSNRIANAESLVPACMQAINAGYPDVTTGEIFEAFASYRAGRRLTLPSAGSELAPSSGEKTTPIKFTINPSLRLVAYTVAGAVRTKDAKEFLDAVLAHPDFRPGFNFIGDRRRMVTARADEYAQSVAALVEANRQQLAPCRWAVLVPNPVAYGMARMWSLMAGETGVAVQPFYELSEAVEWLGLPPATNPELFEAIPESQADTRW